MIITIEESRVMLDLSKFEKLREEFINGELIKIMIGDAEFAGIVEIIEYDVVKSEGWKNIILTIVVRTVDDK